MKKNEVLAAGKPSGALLQRETNPRRRILVVEDERDLRQLNAEVLMDAGYQVDVTEDGATAWTALQLNNYDLLITDQFMPKVSGVELLKKIHDAGLRVPVIMATQIMPTWEFALHPWLQSATMLRKPYTFEKLLGMVKNVLHETASVRAAFAPPQFRQGQSATNDLRP